MKLSQNRRGGVIRSAALVAAVGASWVMSPAAHASDWIEPRSNDAGALAPSAQEPIGFGALDSISGSLDGFIGPGPIFAPRGGGGGGNFDGHDLYRIFIPNPSVFAARTVAVGFGDINTQLYLFSENGRALLGNDNRDSGTPFSRILPSSTDGSFTLSNPGVYVIGVTTSGVLPTSNVPGSGQTPLFATGPSIAILAAQLPAANFPHSGWVGVPETGEYRIEFQGAFFVPAPGAAGIMALGAVLAIRRRRA